MCKNCKEKSIPPHKKKKKNAILSWSQKVKHKNERNPIDKKDWKNIIQDHNTTITYKKNQRTKSSSLSQHPKTRSREEVHLLGRETQNGIFMLIHNK